MAIATSAEALAGFVDVPVSQLANLTPEQRLYLIESLILVEEPETSQPVPLVANAMQREIVLSLADHEITVKWRRGGLTSIYVASAWINVLTRPGWTVELFAHDWDTAKRIFDEVVLYQFNSIPPEFRPTPSKRGGHYIEFDSIGSKFVVNTVGASEEISEKKGQARTINELILTEFAFYRYAEQFIGKIENCVPVVGGLVRIDSTPRGQNSFYRRFKKARAGVGAYKARFFPWWYGGNTRLELEPDETIDDIAGGGPITEEEDRLGLNNPFADDRRGEHKLTPEQIKWRRRKIANIEPIGLLTAMDRFRVEFPEDPETCFLQSGRSFFRTTDLQIRCELLQEGRDEIELDANGEPLKDRNGQPRLTGYKHEHVIGMDTSTGDAAGHPAGIVVIDYGVDPPEQVYEWVGWKPTDEQAELVVEIQKRFPGLIIVERNTPGDSVLQLLRRWDVDGVYKHKERELREHMQTIAKQKPGFPMSSVTKPRVFNALEQALRNRELLLSGPETVSDLKGIKYDDDDRIVYESPFDKGDRGIETHGELAIALALAWEGRKRSGAGVA